MDPATIAGLVLAFAAVVVSVILEGGNPMAMFLAPPMILVFGGTLGVAMAGGTLKDTINSLKAAIKAMTGGVKPADTVVDDIVKLAEKARREGLLALEDAAKSIDDPFLKKGVQMAIDGTDPDEVREILEAEIQAKKKADKIPSKYYADMGAYAPTIGIIGTVNGLIHVLENLDKPETLGHSIAAAFIATLLGVMSANVLFLPLGKRIQRLSDLEVASMELVVEGIASIQAGANPRVVGQKLRAYLPDAAGAEKKAA